jgi:hypothetical protein
MVLYTTPHIWLPSEPVTAALLNAELRDPLTGAQAAWTSWAPTIANWTLGNGTISGAYFRTGKTFHYRFKFTFGSTTTPAGTLLFTVPLTPNASNNHPIGRATINDSGAAFHPALGLNSNGTHIYFIADGGTQIVNATNPMTWATGDTLSFSGAFESVY